MGLTELLAEDAVVRERGAERGAQRLLGTTIGDRDRALIGLVLDGERRPEVREREAPGLLGGSARGRELVGVGGFHGRPA